MTSNTVFQASKGKTTKLYNWNLCPWWLASRTMGGGGGEKKTLQKLANTEPVTSDTNGDVMQTACSCHVDVRRLPCLPFQSPPPPNWWAATLTVRGVIDFSEELSHWEWALKVQKPVPSPVVSLSSTFGSGCELAATAAAAHLPACCQAAHPDGHGLTLWDLTPALSEHFFCKLPRV